MKGIARVGEWSYESFRGFLERNEPVLITARPTWSIMDTPLDYRELQQRYGYLLHVHSNSSTHEIATTPLSHLFDLWEQGKGEELYARDLHLPLMIREAGREVEEELYRVEEILRDDWMNGYYASADKGDFRFVVRPTSIPLHTGLIKAVHGRK